MSSEWKTYTVQELIDAGMLDEPLDGNHGSIHPKASDYVSAGVPFIMANDLVNGKVDYANCAYITEAQASTLRKGFAKPGDVLLTHKATIGRTAIVSDEYDTIILTPQVTYYRVKKGISNRYLKYYFDSSTFQQLFANWAGSGSTRAYLGITAQRKLPIVLPPYEVQLKIAKCCGVLDDKIYQNQRINDNLQQQARSLYKSWFIDFDPFGNTMPADWKNGRLKDVLKLKRQSIKAGSNTVLPYLPIDIIPMRTFALTGFKPNEDAQSSLITFDKDDIIIGAMRVYFHRVVIAPCDGITRTTCFTLSPFQKDYLGFALLCCDQDSSIDYAQSTSKGSTMPYAIWEGGLGDMEIVIPSQKIARKFNELILPMIRQIQNSYFENSRLRELRDGLLPRLMSGKLDVSAIQL